MVPDNDGLHYNLGLAYADGKDYESARASMLKAMALNPNLPQKSAVIACNIAEVFFAVNDSMHALPLVRTALEMEPDNAQAQKLLQDINAKIGSQSSD